jgi:hypothetical protein
MMDSMALEKKYDATPLQVLTDKATRARIVRLKNVTGRSQAQILRDILDFALPRMERLWGIEVPDDELGE